MPALFPKHRRRAPSASQAAPVYEVGPIVGLTSTLWVHSGTRRDGRDLRRPVALVAARLDVPERALRRRAFESAIASFAGLDDPAILRIEDVSEIRGYPFAAAPPLIGSTLARFLARPAGGAKRVSLAFAITIVARLATGVELVRAGQTNGHALANLSADSVWLTPGGAASLLPNVALPIPLRRIESGRDVFRYQAPEVRAGGTGDARSDVYSLALVLWDILAQGRQGASGRAGAGGNAVRWAIDDGVVSLVLRSLSADPEERPTDARAFCRELETIAPVETPTNSSRSADDDPTIEIGTDEIVDVAPSEPETLRIVGGTKPTDVRSLRVVGGDAVPRELRLDGVAARRWIVGRSRVADLSVLDPDVSREHFEISRGLDGSLRIVDLGSKNGLLVNGVSVRQIDVRAGDEVHAGTTTLRFEP